MSVRYPWLLFDADDTLFDYRLAEASAIAAAFAGHGIEVRDDWLAAYQEVNARAWRALEQGTITQARLRVQRFEELFEVLQLELDPSAFSRAYLAQLAKQAHLVEGALEVVEVLRPVHRLAIITNGLADVQRPRLARSPLAAVVDVVVISEEVGVAKPDPAIFALALERMGGPAKRDVLVIGDSLSSDIAGGIAAGLDTCWYNPRALPGRDSAAPTYEIRRLDELPAIVGVKG